MPSHDIIVYPDREIPLRVALNAYGRASLHQTAVPGDIPAGNVVTDTGASLDDVTSQLEADRDELRKKADEAVQRIEKVREDAAAAADDAKARADQAVESVEQVRRDAQTAVQSAKDAAAQAEAKAGEAKAAADAADAKAGEIAGKADELATSITDVKRTVTDQGVRLDGVARNADAAVSASSEVRQTVTALSATVESHYSEQQATLDRVSKVELTANGLESTVSQTARTASDALSKATAAQQTADGFKATVEKEYVSKSDASKTYTTKSELTQTAESLRSSVAADYETKTDSLKKHSDLQQSVDAFRQTVEKEYVSKTDASKTYSAKSELTATAESIGARVDAVARTADGAMAKSTQVELTAEGLTSTVKEQADTLKGQATTISTLKQTTDTLATTITQNARRTDAAAAAGGDLVLDPYLDKTLGNLDQWGSNMLLSATGAPAGAPAATTGHPTGRDQTCAVRLRRGRTYRIAAWIARTTAAKTTTGLGYAGAVDGAGRWVTAFKATLDLPAGTWRLYEAYQTIPQGLDEDPRLWLQVDGTTTAGNLDGWYYTLLSVTDATDARKAQAAADDAVTRVARSEQSLDGFRQTVAQSYETKTDALARQTRLEQTIDGFKQSVADTYATKDGLTSYATKSELTQTSRSLTSRIEEQAKTIDGQAATISTLQQTADTLTSTITQTNATVDALASGTGEAVLDGGFMNGFASWGHRHSTINAGGWGSSAHGNLVQWQKTGTVAGVGDKTFFLTQTGLDKRMKAENRQRTMRVRFEAASAVACALKYGVTLKDDKGSWYEWRELVSCATTYGWTSYAVDLTLPAGRVLTTIAFLTGPAATEDMTWNIGIDNVSVTDVTDLKKAQTSADGALERASELSQSLEGFRLTVKQTYVSNTDAAATYTTKADFKAEKDRITASVQDVTTANGRLEQRVGTIEQNSTSWTAHFKTLDANVAAAQSTANTAKTGADNAAKTASTANTNATNAQNRVGALETCIKMTADGVRVGRIQNGAWTGYSTLVGSDGYFHVKTANGKDVFRAGGNTLEISDIDGKLSMGCTRDDSDHFGVNLYPMISSEPTQRWQTGWNALALSGDVTRVTDVGYTYRGGLICFRGRVKAAKADARVNRNTGEFWLTARPDNRNFVCWGWKNNQLTPINVYIPAKTTDVVVSVVCDWVALDGLTIPQ
ncbi:Phage tail component-like protein [Bifidobacterium ramosum]|uniref:Phage tail component-like protein n=1 Tax=Bifidobacterium ramosum TaxID=1798158 RepID=A0A6L4X3N2_9BIFI|nr:hypothetical protein [Bifidobacterium ramosum]KAB8289302.1 Phage tail component-like protein [Bifidobacterium ramosum]NEG71007.1 hypothetical protein [Bifidobacterium ramosum]